MNLWDSVHRGLEKASNEAGRIAKGQRLRSSIDKMGRQIHERETALFHSVMQLFNSGALTQTELLPLCQELVQLQQQLTQLQAELQQLNIQQQGAPAANNASGVPTGSGGFSTVPPAQIAPTVLSPYGQPTGGNPNPYGDGLNQFPPDHPYADAPISAPPPPAQFAPTVLSPYNQSTGGNPNSYGDGSNQLPPDHPYADASVSTPPPPPGFIDNPALIPPPPPSGGFDATISAQPTALVAPDASVTVCTQCGEPALHSGAFCQNCGSSLADVNTHQPTVRVDPALNVVSPDYETAWTSLPPTPASLDTVHQSESSTPAPVESEDKDA